MPGALAHPGHGLSSRGGFLSLSLPLPLSTSQALVGTGTTGDLGAQQGRGKGSAGMEPLTSLKQVLLPWPRLGRAALPAAVLLQFHHPFPKSIAHSPTPSSDSLLCCALPCPADPFQLDYLLPGSITSSLAKLYHSLPRSISLSQVLFPSSPASSLPPLLYCSLPTSTTLPYSKTHPV